ncbi:MAG TPA: hypothetical protein VFQ24_02880 [Terriglobia bacterium]|nr:hypothetical protein [Terriglobia bacterium]
MYRPTIERIGVKMHRDAMRYSRTQVSLGAATSDGKRAVSAAALVRWPVLAMEIVVLASALSPLWGVQAQPPAPSANVQSPALTEETLPLGSVGRGKVLFAGQVRFRNGGPPCSSCHSIAGLAFPSGGTLGPNLTPAYRKLGPEGTAAALKTLFFPAMTAIYDRRPLTPEEQSDLLTFFQEASAEPQPRSNTAVVALAGFLGFCALLVITRFVWRDRLRSVRERLLEKARTQGESET